MRVGIVSRHLYIFSHIMMFSFTNTTLASTDLATAAQNLADATTAYEKAKSEFDTRTAEATLAMNKVSDLMDQEQPKLSKFSEQRAQAVGQSKSADDTVAAAEKALEAAKQYKQKAASDATKARIEANYSQRILAKAEREYPKAKAESERLAKAAETTPTDENKKAAQAAAQRLEDFGNPDELKEANDAKQKFAADAEEVAAKGAADLETAQNILTAAKSQQEKAMSEVKSIVEKGTKEGASRQLLDAKEAYERAQGILEKSQENLEDAKSALDQAQEAYNKASAGESTPPQASAQQNSELKK